MNTSLQESLSRVVAPIESAATLPPACYNDASLTDTERDAIFKTSWIGVGRSDQWSKPGDYSALNIAGFAIIIIRDKSNALKSFANTCSHRGSLMLEGSGNVQTISCPFHRWTYSLEGDLRGAPEMQSTPDFQKADHDLVAFRCEEREGFAFICLDNSTEDIDNWLGDFSDLHAPWALGSLVTTRRLEFEVDCNWKCFLEVFNEYYHLPYVHADSINSVYARPDKPGAITGCYTSQFSETIGTGGLLEATQKHALPANPALSQSFDSRNSNGTRYTWLFPNMTFAAGSEAIWVYETFPLKHGDPGRCRVAMSVCFPPETIAHPEFESRAQVYYDRMDAALAEDIPALERHQRGLASGFARQGRYCADLEPSVANFAFWYAEKLKQQLY